MTAADDIHKYFHCFSREIRLDVSGESSAASQRIHMKSQALCSMKGKSKELKCRLLLFLFGGLGVEFSLCVCFVFKGNHCIHVRKKQSA